eukprot:539584-Rhodomonas_salina.2
MWELAAKESMAETARERIAVGVSRIDWEAAAGVRQRMTDAQITAANQSKVLSMKRNQTTHTWHKLKGQEEMTELQEKRAEEDERVHKEREEKGKQRGESLVQTRRDQKPIVEELQGFVQRDAGSWRPKRGGNGISRAHLEAPIIAVGRKPVGKMEELLPLCQEILMWNADQPTNFPAVMLWDEEGERWRFCRNPDNDWLEEEEAEGAD